MTGFGPFMQHKVNASWVAVQELAQLGLKQDGKEVPLEIREVEVAYNVVSSTVPKLYDEINPRLCVHVGVSPYNVVKLERFGKNQYYTTGDVYSRNPPGLVCVHGGPDSITTCFDVERVCVSASQKQRDVTFETSNDAGRYLCDFIYYTSLYQNKGPVLFVHVPELDKPYSKHQLAWALKSIIETLLDEMKSLG